MSYYHPQARMQLTVRFEDFGDDDLSNRELTYTVEPKDLRVEINDYTKADKFHATLDYSNFPFDPRTVRSLQVTVYMADNMGLDKQYDLDPKDAVFTGFADEDTIRFASDGRKVSLEGRDLTSIFIDAQWDQIEPISVDRPIDQVINSIVRMLPAAKNIKIENRTSSATLPILSHLDPDFGKSQASGKRGSRNNQSYWDVIQKIASEVALICYIDYDILVLTDPSDHYTGKDVSYFVWGKNLKSLDLKRNIGRRGRFNVEIRSLVGNKIETIRIPEEGSTGFLRRNNLRAEPYQRQRVDGKGEIVKDPATYIQFSVTLKTKDQLQSIGEKTYEMMARQELEGSFETKDMFVATYKDAQASKHKQVAKIRNGNAVKIIIENEDIESISSITSEQKRYTYLRSRGYPQHIAKTFAESLGRFSPYFYVRSLDLKLSSTDGFTMKCNFINFIEQTHKGLGL